MKNKLVYFIFITFFVLSCSNDFLDKTLDEDLSLDDVFSDRAHTMRFLTSCYGYLPGETNFNDNNCGNPFVGASDEMDITWTYPMSNKMNAGAWNAYVVEENGTQIWSLNYKGLRQCNLFLENISKTPVDEEQRNAYTGEACFLRAFFHFLLLRTHGPIPVVDHAISMDENFNIPRNTFDEGVQFIIDDCDRALASQIPMKPASNFGRVTKAAALALKSRVLLYAASPLFNGNPDYAGFSNNDNTKLFAPEDKSKWQKAAGAAKDCIEQLEASGYKLYYETGNPLTSDPKASYEQLFISKNNWSNDEVIFARTRGSNSADSWHHEKCLSPNGMGGWSGLCPTQEMVDAYEMEDGSTPVLGYNSDASPIINPASGYIDTGYVTQAHPKGYYPGNIRNMYAGREPRFYASINFCGQLWRGRPIEFWRSGQDGAAKSSVDYCITGYLMRKTSSPATNLIQGTGYMQDTWIFMRLAEIYLNYAEALNEAQGPVADVYKYVNLIRQRAGLPELPAGLTQKEMRQKIRHERQIELAFETHRYFDCHRWKIAEETDNRIIHGMAISKGAKLQDDAFYERTPLEKRIFEKKHYLWPVPQSEIDKTSALVQSPFWETN